jgi:hypothetical protein
MSGKGRERRGLPKKDHGQNRSGRMGKNGIGLLWKLRNLNE